MTYRDFLESKVVSAPKTGISVSPAEISPALKPHQRDAVLWALAGGRRALFEAFGLGKCHGKGTKILMYDCSIKNVEDVKVGDLLMGDDGTPRKVYSLAHGIDDMYKVTLKNGDSFTCNKAHILSLEMSNRHNGHKMGEIVNLSINEYLNLPRYAKKNCYKAYKRPLNFGHIDVKFDPYVYGVWLGDGTKKNISFTINKQDVEIINYLKKWGNALGFKLRIEEGRGCLQMHFHNGTKNNQHYFERDFVTGSYIDEKRIYKEYLINSKEIRLQVLAGLLDTDGYLIDNCYEIATKFKGLRDDILFLCRSLGFSVTHTIKFVKDVPYYRIWISGNTHEIPCKTRKKAKKRKQIKNPLKYGFEVTPLGKGEYFGFTIDGNHLYMLADFTVTHNTLQQLEWCRILSKKTGGKALIICPLGVKQEFARDAVELLHIEPPQYVRTMEEVRNCTAPIMITNYERVRDGDIYPKYFTAVTLDEASVLRSFGSKTYQTFLRGFKGIPYKLVATATPSPNRYKELIHYAGYLEIMDTAQALTRFFQRDSTKANNLTIYPHKQKEFWLWLSTWALFLQKPSDLGYSDEGYDLPPLEVRYHKLQPSDVSLTYEKDGQGKMIPDFAVGLSQASKEKRESIDVRIAEMKRIVEESPDDSFILWHDLEAERHAIKKALPECKEIYGSQDLETRERNTIDFSEGKYRLLATKKELSGSGCNFQRHCHREIFVGIDYEFNDFIQAIHRCYRFMQDKPVIVDIIYMETEQEILKVLKEKWKQYDEMTEKMEQIIKKYGLAQADAVEEMKRSIGVERIEVTGERYRAIHNDCVEELKNMPENSVDEIITSIPFGNHYEYCESYNDFGHNENTERFFEQMDYMTPNLLKVLKPGRVYCCHVKDRILFGNTTGTGMPTVEPFHALTIMHYIKHGFQFMGMITVVTDVVRENNQTYRLGWTEQCKDGTKMGVGCEEYILLFRKLPTDTSNAYADEPVVKSKDEYSRGRWQIDAHGYWRTSGNRLISKDELLNIPVKNLQKAYRKYSRETVYNYDEHVKLANELDKCGKLPASFMVIAPGSWNDSVWDDINRMKTLNTQQKLKRKQMHLCPLQIDVVERLVDRYSNEGDTILDPFGGLMTVPLVAMQKGRKGIGIELNPDYFRDGVGYLQTEEEKQCAPTLFDFVG